MPLPSAHSSNRSSRRASFRSASSHLLRSDPGEQRDAVADRRLSRPTSSTPRARERVQVEGAPVGRPDQLRRGNARGRGRGRRSRRAPRRGRRRAPSTTRCRARGTCAACARARPPRASPGDPSAWISSASWTPVADAPTTRTPTVGQLRRAAGSRSASPCSDGAGYRRGQGRNARHVEARRWRAPPSAPPMAPRSVSTR